MATKDSVLSTIDLINREPRKPFAWWHRLAAPPEPKDTLSMKVREEYRRAIYISYTLLILTLIDLVLLIIVGGLLNHSLIIPFAVELILGIVGVFLNRLGRVVWAGIVITLALEATTHVAVLVQNGHFSLFYLPLFDLFIIPELFVVSLLPAYFIFFDAGYHIFIIWFFLVWLNKDPQTTDLLRHAFALTLIRPVILQIATAGVAFTWITSVNSSLNRASRATSIALFERQVAYQAQEENTQKQQLEREIQIITHVLSQASNDEYRSRIVLEQGALLWSVAGALNNMLARLQRSLKSEGELRRTRNALTLFFNARLEAGNGPIRWTKTYTPVDAIVQQHNNLVTRSFH